MKIQWMTAALLSSALVVGCGDRGSENTQNMPENQGTAADVAPEPGAPVTQAPAPEQPALSPDSDTSTARFNTSGARSTSGNRPAARPAPAPPAPTEVAPPRTDRFDTAPRRAAAPPAPRVTVRTITIPAGTALPLELTTAVSTETASVEMPVSARLRRAVTVDGATVLPAGATVNGEVIEVDRPGRVQGRARLGLRFTSVTVDGRR